MMNLIPGSRSIRLHLVLPLALAGHLAACGGGSGGGDGGTTALPSAPPLPATSSLTLKGAVTDEPVPSAIVIATVGDETFMTTADPNGNYILEIEIEEADADSFVTLVAEGTDQQSFVVFTSLIGSFASLMEQAGDDGTLSNDENFGTQITNVSTAEAALLQQANGGEPITSDEELQELGAEVNGQDVLDLATAIKLAVDQAGDYPLPEGTTILDIVSDPEAWPAFVADAWEQDPKAFDATQTAIVEDPDLTQPVAAEDVPETLTAAILSTDENFTFNLGNRVAAFTFNADGTGSESAGTYSQAMTWAIDGNDIAVTYMVPVETFGYPSEDCDGLFRQVYSSFVSEGAKLTLLSERTVAITRTTQITYLDCPSLASTEVTETAARTIVTDEDFRPILDADVENVAQTIYVYDGTQPVDPIVADIADLAADGSGSTRLLGKTFTWKLNGAGSMVTATFGDGSVGRYRVLHDFDELGSDLFFEIETVTDRYVDANLSAYLDPELPLEFLQTNVSGSYFQFGVGEETVPDPRLEGFYLRLDEDGTGAQVYDYLDDSDNVVLVDETVDPDFRLRWVIEPEGLILRRTYGNCVYTAVDCVMFDVRRLVPLGSFDVAGGSRSYVLEKRHLNWNGLTAATPATYLVRYYDTKEETSELVGSAKLGSASLRTRRHVLIPRDPGPNLR